MDPLRATILATVAVLLALLLGASAQTPYKNCSKRAVYKQSLHGAVISPVSSATTLTPISVINLNLDNCTQAPCRLKHGVNATIVLTLVFSELTLVITDHHTVGRLLIARYCELRGFPQLT